ncbi:hypothetical protein BDZ89DRAFT_1100671 [Hymenopellis radicata]|nr:hypothetical protein BDZ89DRAFT_1100671 [Hymenopellis radicata]
MKASSITPTEPQAPSQAPAPQTASASRSSATPSPGSTQAATPKPPPVPGPPGGGKKKRKPPDISSLTINDDSSYLSNDILDDDLDMDNYDFSKLRTYAKSLATLCHRSRSSDDRVVQCVEARGYDVGLLQWDSMINYCIIVLRYLIPKEKRICLAKIYFYVVTIPGMSTQMVATRSDAFKLLTKSKKRIGVDGLRLPWKPVYEILSADLFLSPFLAMRQHCGTCSCFFHPAAINDMLSTFVPQINGINLNSVLSSQYYLLTFLPLTHPQSYLPMLLRMWVSLNSYIYDDRTLSFLSKLAEMHVSPEVSNPLKITEIPDDERSAGETRPKWAPDDAREDFVWSGIYKDIGIFTEHEWGLIMCKCLASMEIPLADAGSLSTGPSADNQMAFEIGRLPKANWRIPSLARIIVYSMAPDGYPTPASNAPTPYMTPMPSGMSTPQIQSTTAGEYLGIPLGKTAPLKGKTYLAGSRALDSLARLIASTESFFPPSNPGAWAADLSAFIKCIVYDFNKRWHEEQRPDCKTKHIHIIFRQNRRLTRSMKRELVKCLRTVVLLAMFSQDSATVSNIQSCFKSMNVMEPDLILHPVLERAVPSLEALVETQRTIAVIKALGAVAPAIASRQVYYPGAKHLAPILQLLIPGIDLDSTGSFADWVTSFVGRVIQLLENLPDEGPNGAAGGATEVQVVDAVTGACSQICVHLSEPLFDLVLNMIFEYVSTNVRPNAVRAIHRLVEFIANAYPRKTLAKFFPFCARNIRTEWENGASSLRTASASTPIPSDATLHWNLAILRGTQSSNEIMSLLQLLQAKTFSKRGYSWTGKMLASMLLTLTHTYPLENKFFRWNHHRHWGKLYAPDDIEISWHIPNAEEINFALDIFRQVIEPTLGGLEELLKPAKYWCELHRSNLSLVRNAFSGIPTLAREYLSDEEIRESAMTSDILDEIPEMLASVPPMTAGFCLTDRSDPKYQYIRSLRHRYGVFLHSASVSLRQQGEENTVDAVHMLIRSFRVYLLEYGDSRDSFYVNEEQFNNEKNVARQYARQKVWPRAVYVRRARYFHSGRLRWNSLERLRGPLEDSLIDDLVEWSMWHYAMYDGVRRRTLPLLSKALEPGTEDDRMKGALWTLNYPSFGRYAIGEPKLAAKLLPQLLRCQHNEKPSIQDCVSAVSENCVNNFVEPCYLGYAVSSPGLLCAVERLKEILPPDATNDYITQKCLAARVERMQKLNEAADQATIEIMKIATSPKTHWRYEIVAIRCLRTLLRRDVPLTSVQIRFFLERTHHTHPSVYAQRGVMKSLAEYLFLGRSRNPLKEDIRVEASHALTSRYLHAYKSAFNLLFLETFPQGWVAWGESITVYKSPDAKTSTFQPWDPPSHAAIDALRKMATDTSYWKKLSTYFAEENNEVTMTQDNVSCVKSLFQVLEDAPFAALKPILESLIVNKEQDKQRAAAELLAGIIGGSKHWPLNKQKILWDWFKPFMKTIMANLKTDTLVTWTSFLEYVFYRKDPRRVQSIMDCVLSEVMTMDFNAELSFDVIKVLSLFRACYEEMGWKFTAWLDQILQRCWKEIHCEHDDVRTYIAEFMSFADKIKWSPRPTIPSAEVFVKECRVLPVDYDIMGMRGAYHKIRVSQLVVNFAQWREERIPGVRAFQSKYDRVGIMVCKWLFQSIHDVHAISVFDYILPLMPELFRLTEVNDNDELANIANLLLVRMCGVTPPRALINPLLDAIFDAIRTSPSWKVRLKALPLVQVFYFRQVPLISEVKVVEILEVLCKCLDDEVVEVREMAASTLSGILRLSPRRSVLTLKDRFVKLAKNSYIPERQHPDYNVAIRRRHAAILGICALVDSYPYTVEKWMPDLLTNVLAEHTYDPLPIATTVRKCASNFKRTHQDTWHEDSKRFTDDQLSSLSTLITGSSYLLSYLTSIHATRECQQVSEREWQRRVATGELLRHSPSQHQIDRCLEFSPGGHPLCPTLRPLWEPYRWEHPYGSDSPT